MICNLVQPAVHTEIRFPLKFGMLAPVRKCNAHTYKKVWPCNIFPLLYGPIPMFNCPLQAQLVITFPQHRIMFLQPTT